MPCVDCDLGCGDGCGDGCGGEDSSTCSTVAGCLDCSDACDLLPTRKNPEEEQASSCWPWAAQDVVDRAALVAVPGFLAARPMRWWSGSRRLGIAAIRMYQRHISPRLPTRCRYTPSCSAYGLDAVQAYGLITGSRLALGRIRRCTRHVPHGTPDPLRLRWAAV